MWYPFPYSASINTGLNTSPHVPERQTPAFSLNLYTDCGDVALHCPVAAPKLSSSHERRLQRATNLTITTLASPKETQTFARTRTTIQNPTPYPNNHHNHADRTRLPTIPHSPRIRHSQHQNPKQPPIPNILPLRRSSRHPRPRILQRLPLLPSLLDPHNRIILRRTDSADGHPGGGSSSSIPKICRRRSRRVGRIRYEPVLQESVRVLDGRAVEWVGGFHSDVDFVFRSCEGLKDVIGVGTLMVGGLTE